MRLNIETIATIYIYENLAILLILFGSSLNIFISFEQVCDIRIYDQRINEDDDNYGDNNHVDDDAMAINLQLVAKERRT